MITITVKLVILTFYPLALRSFVEYIIKYKPGEQLILVLSHDPLLISTDRFYIAGSAWDNLSKLSEAHFCHSLEYVPIVRMMRMQTINRVMLIKKIINVL